MNKKIYLTPTVRLIDLVEEGLIATSAALYDEEVGEEFTQKKEDNFWGRDGIWK